jgi:hypothetical protein
MRAAIRRWIRAIVRRDALWSVLEPTIVRLGISLSDHRKAAFIDECKEWCNRHVSQKKVLNGVFQGMKYSSFTAFGSELYPKLLGSYELEIQEAITELTQTSFDVVVDVGCAEGYYAVGFALQNPNTLVHAFDLNESAQQECLAMAKCNKVADRVRVESYCDSYRLVELSKTGRSGLILSDCEGFERHLFSEGSAIALKSWHLLIETHDFASSGVTEWLSQLFKNTHNIRTFAALPDEDKVNEYQFDEIKGLDRRIQHMLLTEKRPAGMKWLYMTPSDSES